MVNMVTNIQAKTADNCKKTIIRIAVIPNLCITSESKRIKFAYLVHTSHRTNSQGKNSIKTGQGRATFINFKIWSKILREKTTDSQLKPFSILDYGCTGNLPITKTHKCFCKPKPQENASY